jgi:hypothetical protein
MRAGVPRIGELPVFDRPLDRADHRVRRLWGDAQAQLDDKLAAPPPALADYAAWAQGTFSPWVKRRTEAAKQFAADAEALLGSGSRERLFATAVTASLYDDMLTQLRALPAPASPADAQSLFRKTLEDTTVPLARTTADAYKGCAKSARGAPDAMAGWKKRCEKRAEEVEALAVRAPEPAAALAVEHGPVAPPAPSRPPECATEEKWDDPQAPAADLSAPLEVAVLYDGNRLKGAEAGALLEAVAERVRAIHGHATVGPFEVMRAEALVEAKKWRDDALVCGQPPPLPALLAERHPNLALAKVSTQCFRSDSGEGELCSLEVRFRRPGAPGEPVPGTLAATPTDTRSAAGWIEAARALEQREGLLGGIFGLAMSSTRFYRVGGTEDDDPWLRIAPTLVGAAGEKIRKCHPGKDVASFLLRWTIAPDGSVISSGAEAITPPKGDARKESLCIADALLKSAWPCPRSGAPTAVEARVCIGE